MISWWKHKDDPNFLFLKYEDRLKVRIYSEVETLKQLLITEQFELDIQREEMEKLTLIYKGARRYKISLRVSGADEWNILNTRR